MATKRKFREEPQEELKVGSKKHTLDSDEEDSESEKEDLNDSDIEGAEDGEAKVQDEVKITPFNMREELEEGHFDKNGHYHWNKKSRDNPDNWLDNIDWVKIKSGADNKNTNPNQDDSNDSLKHTELFNEQLAYAQMLTYMEKNETVESALKRLGKRREKISTAERLRRKKLGITDEAAEKIIKFTELTNNVLTKTGNMDIYQLTYDQVKSKCSSAGPAVNASSSGASNDCDMYADDFEEKEEKRLKTTTNEEDKSEKNENKLLWEFKWKKDDTKVNGPYSTLQMLKWSQEKYFKEGVHVRKVGESANFYSSNRIDFDLYL